MTRDDEYHGRSSHPIDQPSGAESAPAHRTPTQRDRDRVLYSSAFRRLAGITQVASPEVGHLFHNRLTHTLKVAQVAVRLTQRLLTTGVDPAAIDIDAVETAALAHDLGHPPFGHVAERELDKLARSWGGFEGNAQSFRIVTKLAVNKHDYWGLGLTAQSLNALLKYPWLRGENEDYPDKWGAFASERDEFLRARYGHARFQRSLEAQIMDWADDVTFAVHDLEDFFRAGLIPLDRVLTSARERDAFVRSLFVGGDPAQGLRRNLARDGVDEAAIDAAVEWLFGGEVFGDMEPFGGSRASRLQLRRSTSFLISRYDREVRAITDAGRSAELVIAPSLRAEVAVLKELTWFYVIRRPSLAVLQEGQRRIIATLFVRYRHAAEHEDARDIFPALERELLERARDKSERVRIVVDLISGLTEPMVYELHHRVTGISPGSILDSAARAL